MLVLELSPVLAGLQCHNRLCISAWFDQTRQATDMWQAGRIGDQA